MMELHGLGWPSGSVLVVTSAVILITGVLYLSKPRRASSEGDILLSILDKTAPLAAAGELTSSGSMTCVRKINGSVLVITKDPNIAHYIFKGKSRFNYVRRPASDEGLKRLGMYEQGLIWNNNTDIWKRIRGCFQEALNSKNIDHATSSIKTNADDILTEGALDMMNVCRRLTFRATLSTFFGISSCDYDSLGIREDQFINAIISYFKAWEFFLLRPTKYWDRQLANKHSASVKELQSHVTHLLSCIDFSAGIVDNSTLFVHRLYSACQELENTHQALLQSSLEMMLAGTDTSSVTAYYALLGLAGDQELQSHLRKDFSVMRDASKSKVLRSIVDETLRFKPVGPVVLREAVNDDPTFPGIRLTKGTAILIHLAEMNLCDGLWSDPTSDPRSFCPMRFLDKDPSFTETKFYPFGHGPKGCIGMHLGRSEVNKILETVVRSFNLNICGHGTLGSLETHWDIANQPDKPMLIKLVKV
ncbi:hypothetical protein ACHAWF_018846 [Thalassiosira exigua]